MADNSEVQINWSRQLVNMLQDQARIVAELDDLKRSTAKYRDDVARHEVRFDEICRGISDLKEMASHQTASAVSRDRGQGPDGTSRAMDSDTVHIPLGAAHPTWIFVW